MQTAFADQYTDVTDDSTVGNSAGLDPNQIAALNAAYEPLDFGERIRRVYDDFAPDKVLVTSSFAATSAYFLHIISSIRPDQEISFIDTGYHFQETISYREFLSAEYGLKVRALRAEDWKHEFTRKDKTWSHDPDFCCSINNYSRWL